MSTLEIVESGTTSIVEVPASTGPVGPRGPKGLDGKDGYMACHVQPDEPNFYGEQALWVQTGLGPDGTKVTFWVNI